MSWIVLEGSWRVRRTGSLWKASGCFLGCNVDGMGRVIVKVTGRLVVGRMSWVSLEDRFLLGID